MQRQPQDDQLQRSVHEWPIGQINIEDQIVEVIQKMADECIAQLEDKKDQFINTKDILLYESIKKDYDDLMTILQEKKLSEQEKQQKRRQETLQLKDCSSFKNSKLTPK